MAVNPNPRHPALHTLYIAATGGGKSQAVKQSKRAGRVPARGGRVVFWDVSEEHHATHYHKRADFVAALKRSAAAASFRIAYVPQGEYPAEWEWFCKVVWALLDGDRITYVVGEELSAVCATVSRAGAAAAQLLNQGRKYGLIFHGTTQRPQEIAKTYYDACPIKWIGQQAGAAMQRKMAEQACVRPGDIAALNQLEFYVHDGTAAPATKVKLKYKG